jgi:kynurenine formamidase
MNETKRWTRRPEGSTWGDWGEDDQLGRLNLLTPEKVLQGIAEVRVGRTFCLSLPLDVPGGNVVNPRRLPPVLSPTSDENGPRFNFRTGTLDARHTDVVSDDRVTLTLQYSTQWDSLAHVGGMFDVDGDGAPEAVYYNGFRAGNDVVGPLDGLAPGSPTAPGSSAVRGGSAAPLGGHTSYAHRLSVANLAEKPIQGRAVLVDLERHLGRDHVYVGYDQLCAILVADGVTVEPGDMLVLHTGWATELVAMGGAPDPDRVHAMCAVLDGRDERLLDWITRSQIAALISDNYGVEAFPARDCGPADRSALPLHRHCLFTLGVNLGEMWYLDELARWLREHDRSRFLLTAPPLRLPGAVGSPANPIATV